MFGYSKEELYRLAVYEIVDPEHREMIKEAAKRRLKGEQFERIYTEFPVRTKDGTLRYTFIYAKTVTWNNRQSLPLTKRNSSKRSVMFWRMRRVSG